MIHFKSDDEIELIAQSAELLGRAHGLVAKNIKPGVKTVLLDQLADEFIRDHGGIPSFKNFNGFPYSLCISMNEQVVHGFPGEVELKEGDIVSIDCGVLLNGFHSDSAFTYPIGEVSDDIMTLLKVTKSSLYAGIENMEKGKRLGDVSNAIQRYVEPYKYGIVRELVGHGIGRSLHEAPEVPNYGKSGKGMKLKEGLVLAIEPMINLGGRSVVQENDGWTIRTSDKKPSAHFEHTVAITSEGTRVLTTHKYIEEVFKF
ncbi:MAG: type I methionyl aminopeptidase [Bacteroidota bacterium]